MIPLRTLLLLSVLCVPAVFAADAQKSDADPAASKATSVRFNQTEAGG